MTAEVLVIGTIDPVAGTLAGTVLGVLGTLGTQWLAARHNLERERTRTNAARLDKLRDLLTVAAIAVQEVGIAFDDAGNKVTWIERGELVVKDEKGTALNAIDATRGKVDDAREALGRVYRCLAQLAVLVDRKHESYRGLAALSDAYYDSLVAYGSWARRKMDTAALLSRLNELQSVVAAAEQRFFDGSRSIVGPALR